MAGKLLGKHLSKNATICATLRFAFHFIASLKVPYLRCFRPFSAPSPIFQLWSWRELVRILGVVCIYAGLRVVYKHLFCLMGKHLAFIQGSLAMLIVAGGSG